MRYTLRSRGCVVGYTDLDIHTVTPTMRQGFIEPTEEGKPLLVIATGLWRAMAEVKRGKRARGGPSAGDDALILQAMKRREELDFELCDENETVLEFEFIRLYDLFDLHAGVVDEMSDTEEEEEAEFQIRVSALSGEAREDALAERARMNAEIEAEVDEMLSDRDERSRFGSAWPPPPPVDPRWETMQYHLQAVVKSVDGEPD
jgi:hypothetical protein